MPNRIIVHGGDAEIQVLRWREYIFSALIVRLSTVRFGHVQAALHSAEMIAVSVHFHWMTTVLTLSLVCDVG